MDHPFHSAPVLLNDPEANEHFIQIMSPFSEVELNAIRMFGDQLSTRPISLYGAHDELHVNASGADFPRDPSMMWVYEKMSDFAQKINAETFKYDLTGFHENFYYLTYNGDQNEHFGWHVDMGGETPAPRKLTFQLQLSRPDEYEGGVFEIFTAASVPYATDKGQGVVTIFPSWKSHKVTPVTKGVRRAISMFAVGPNFR